MLSLKPLATAVVTQRAEESNSFSNPSPQLSSFHCFSAFR